MKKIFFMISLITLFTCLAGGLYADSRLDQSVSELTAKFDLLQKYLGRIKLADSPQELKKISVEISALSAELKEILDGLMKRFPRMMGMTKTPKELVPLTEKIQSMLPEMKTALLKLKLYQEYPEVKSCINMLNNIFE